MVLGLTFACSLPCSAARDPEFLVIPPDELLQMLETTLDQFPALSRRYGLTEKADEIVSEQEGTIELCYGRSRYTSFKLCQGARLPNPGAPDAYPGVMPSMAFILANSRTTDVRAYERFINSPRCGKRKTEQIAGGTSTRCELEHASLTLQKRDLPEKQMSFQIYAERLLPDNSQP